MKTHRVCCSKCIYRDKNWFLGKRFKVSKSLGVCTNENGQMEKYFLIILYTYTELFHKPTKLFHLKVYELQAGNLNAKFKGLT